MRHQLYIRILPLLIIVLSVAACKTAPKGNYRYFNEFSEYLRSEHRINTSENKDDLYYAIGIDPGCECTYLNLSFVRDSLQDVKSRLHVILVGDHAEERNSAVIDSLRSKGFHFMNDKERKIFIYSVGFGKPLFLHFKDKRGVYGQTVNDSELHFIRSYLDGKL